MEFNKLDSIEFTPDNIETLLFVYLASVNIHFPISNVLVRHILFNIGSKYSNWFDVMNSKKDLSWIYEDIFKGFRTFLRQKNFKDKLNRLLEEG